MSKRNKPRSQSKLPQAAANRSAVRWAVAVALSLGIGAWAFYFFAPLSGARDSAFDKLNGRWLRLDGGYVLAIKNVAAGGAMDAAYFNPNPIHVAKAAATREGARLQVFVELRAPNYPGSTYTLTYDPEQDQLRGDYFQAVERQTFKVSFVRMK